MTGGTGTLRLPEPLPAAATADRLRELPASFHRPDVKARQF